jgi:hypothetical protein
MISPLFEIARVVVCFKHVARFIVNADHSIVRGAVELGVIDCVRLAIPQATKRQRVGNQINAGMIAGRTS